VLGVLQAAGAYRPAFAVLAVPAALALGTLVVARRLSPEPERLEARAALRDAAAGLPPPFWRYLGAVACLAAGYADYPLVAFHLKQAAVLGDAPIVALYALAMGVDALAALVLGRLFDRRGLRVLVPIPLLSWLFAPLAFSRSPALVAAGVVLWGVGLGAQESVVRAALAAMVPAAQRGTAFGVFHAVYGTAWFAGSAVMGWLYDRSVAALVAFSMTSQLLAVPWLAGLGTPAPAPEAGHRR
jgi:predicted MFS family arabinose efflux permease